MNYANYETLAFSRDGAVLTVKLNRPQALNAVSQRLHTELSRVFAEIAADPTVDAVVLSGEGRAFSAGGDLDWFLRISGPQLDALFVEARRIILDLVDLPQPIIAAVNGTAAGLGATLALFCDVVYVAEEARISDPHVRIGVTAGDGGAVIWPLLVGPARAKEYLMTGDSLTAAEAERIGLVNRIVDGDLTEAGKEFARQMTGYSLPVLGLARDAIRRSHDLPLHDGLQIEADLSTLAFQTKDAAEGMTAFVEKRKPVFRDG